MDVDFDNDPVDQNLLQLFSCMGTTDKDELVRQMLKVVGNNINTTTATFFLDMNNWNLQAAVCSYFDFEQSFKMPSMSLVRDELSEESLEYPAGSSFRKVWQVQNTGDECWPVGCYMQFAAGDLLQGTNERIPLPPLAPRACHVVTSADITLPATPGVYKTKFRIATPTGAYFGDIIWMIVTVRDEEEAMANDLADQLSHLGTSVQPPPPSTTLEADNRLNDPFGVPVPTNTHTHFQDSAQPGSNDYMC